MLIHVILRSLSDEESIQPGLLRPSEEGLAMTRLDIMRLPRYAHNDLRNYWRFFTFGSE